MSDMGFLPDVRRILDLTPASRQTMLFSATLDGAVGVLSRHYQSEPVSYEVVDESSDSPSNAVHLFWTVDNAERNDVATNLLSAVGPTIVFCRTRRGADRLAKRLAVSGVRTDALHGGRSQNQRDRALRSFAVGGIDALVATDVAARGIHVEGVACVVHFDTAEDEKAYLHRSGRTARAGAVGVRRVVRPGRRAEGRRTHAAHARHPVALHRPRCRRDHPRPGRCGSRPGAARIPTGETTGETTRDASASYEPSAFVGEQAKAITHGSRHCEVLQCGEGLRIHLA